MVWQTRLQFVVLASLLLALPAQADSPVWKVEKNNHALFLAGSVHFLGADDYPLPGAFDRAYAESEILVLETDIERMQSPEFAPALMARMTYPPGDGLRQRLTPETWAALERYLAKRGLVAEQLASFRPGLLASTLLVLELQRLGVAGAGVDQHFDQRAQADGRQRRYLETIERQVELLAEMGEGDEDAFVRYSLEDAKQMSRLWQGMVSAWRDGDLVGLRAIALDPMRRELPALIDDLLLVRNREWLPQIEAMLSDAPVELVIVGALHLGGEGGLLEMLEARGYRLVQLR